MDLSEGQSRILNIVAELTLSCSDVRLAGFGDAISLERIIQFKLVLFYS